MAFGPSTHGPGDHTKITEFDQHSRPTIVLNFKFLLFKYTLVHIYSKYKYVYI